MINEDVCKLISQLNDAQATVAFDLKDCLSHEEQEELRIGIQLVKHRLIELTRSQVFH